MAFEGLGFDFRANGYSAGENAGAGICICECPCDRRRYGTADGIGVGGVIGLFINAVNGGIRVIITLVDIDGILLRFDAENISGFGREEKRSIHRKPRSAHGLCESAIL